MSRERNPTTCRDSQLPICLPQFRKHSWSAPCSLPFNCWTHYESFTVPGTTVTTAPTSPRLIGTSDIYVVVSPASANRATTPPMTTAPTSTACLIIDSGSPFRLPPPVSSSRQPADLLGGENCLERRPRSAHARGVAGGSRSPARSPIGGELRQPLLLGRVTPAPWEQTLRVSDHHLANRSRRGEIGPAGGGTTS
jgi:hypothetical protein